MSRIPNYFHFVFGLAKQNEPFHLLYYLCLKSCIEVNKPEKIYFYYQHEPYGPYWELIKPYLELVKVEPNSFISEYSYSKKGKVKFSYAHHADFIRLEKLIEKGGVYADMDTLFVHKIPDTLFEKPFVLGREPDVWSESAGAFQHSLCNALIMSEKNSVFAKRWLEQMQANFDGTWSNHSTLLPYKLSVEFPDHIHIEPQRSFYRFAWNKDDLKDLFEDKITDLAGMYSIHLWKHIWFSKWKTDFITFHGGQLTAEYIKSETSTYAMIAKPYLPNRHELAGVAKTAFSKRASGRIKKATADADYLFERLKRKLKIS